MVNENLANLVNNKKAQVEEVREIENKDLEQQQKSITESVKETVLPVAHASDDDDKDAKIEQRDTLKEARDNDRLQKKLMKQEIIDNCEIS